MTDRPIIFSVPMVRALLDGRKTMTRRLADQWRRVPDPVGKLKLIGNRPSSWRNAKPGDRLWVRESLRKTTDEYWLYAADGTIILMERTDQRVTQMIGWAHHKEGDRAPSIHMPRWASRLTLIVTATKIEKVQAITDAEAIAEGVTGSTERGYSVEGFDLVGKHPRSAFAALWSMLHGYNFEGWDANPEVVALTFTVAKHNIDTLPKAGEARTASQLDPPTGHPVF